MDQLLYGHNPEERIVAVEQLNDQTVRLFKRMEGKILHQDVEFFPFFFLSDDSLIKEFPKKFWLKELAGNNTYRFIAAFTRWSEMWEAVHFILRQYNKTHSPRVSSYQELKEILVRSDAVRQFLLQSGMTLFKGLEFNELVRLHIDIQYVPASGKKRSGKGLKERILVIAITTSDGNEYVLSSQKQDERTVLEHCIRHINKIDPDVIEGYDLFGTILPVLSRGCERHQVSLTIGRDGSDMRIPGGHGAPGFGESEWFSFDVFGRHLIDILTVAEAEIDPKRAEQSFSLTSLAKHFDIPHGIGHTIPPHQIYDEWNHDPKRVIDQSLCYARIVRDLSNLLTPPLFYLARICPFNYRMLTQLSAIPRIESLILREYMRQRHSVPKPFEGSRNINVPAEIFQVGVFNDILYIELQGIYTSIILRQRIKPRTDELNVFLPLVEQLSSLRRELLDHLNTDRVQQNHINSQLIAVEFLLGSFHFYLGSGKGVYNDPDQAEVVLAASKEILKEIVHQIELFNATIIQFDGQGFFLLAPDNIVGDANRKNFVERLSSTLPEGINLSLSYSYKGIFSYRKSNYAVLDQNDNVIIRGNSLISRSTERYLRALIHRFIECLLTNDFKRLHHAYATAYTQVEKHKWMPIDFCRTELSRTDTETYQKDVAAGQAAPSAAMEAAVRSSLFVKANSKIAYYISGTEMDANIARSARLAEEWDPNLPDENTAYYLARLHETVNKFREFFEPTAFERILSLDEMFGFSDEGIHILGRKIVSETPETKPETEDYGIWLGETE